jgi:hypothetical protein
MDGQKHKEKDEKTKELLGFVLLSVKVNLFWCTLFFLNI